MNTKMTFGGIGPKLALLTLPYVLLTTLFILRNPEFLRMYLLDYRWIETLGYLWIGIGLVFYIATIRVFLTDFKKGLLVTRGTFSLCRNPLYASFIIFIIPGLALVFNSGMILSIALVLYLNFKLSIHGETKMLQQNFGAAYENYCKSVNEIVPFPRFRNKKSL